MPISIACCPSSRFGRTTCTTEKLGAAALQAARRSRPWVCSISSNPSARSSASATTREAPKAEELKKELDSHKLGTDKVEVAVKGDTVVLKGVVKDQSIFEKAVIAVGNTLGVSKVEADELKVVAPDSGLKLDGNVDMTELVTAATPAKEPRFYTVKKGDNLSKIAESAIRQGQGVEIHRHLRGQQADAEASGQDLSRPGAAHPRSGNGLTARAPVTFTRRTTAA